MNTQSPSQPRVRWRAIALAYLLPGLFLLALAFQQQVSMRTLTADVPAVTKLPTYVGLVSNLGILAWGAAATVCGFALVMLPGAGPWRRFFGTMLAVTLLLLLDDMLMLHERVLPWFSIPESVYYLVYPLIVVVVAVTLRNALRQTNLVLLVLALGLLGFSMGVDFGYETILDVYHGLRGDAPAQVMETGEATSRDDEPTRQIVVTDGEARFVLDEKPYSLAANLYYLAEDGSKFLGIIGWLIYLTVTARDRIAASFKPQG